MLQTLCSHLQDEPSSLETSASHVYATDESGATVRLVCIPVGQLNLENSMLNCSSCMFNHLLSTISAVNEHIKNWTNENKIILNMSKTKEIVFRRPCPVRFHLSPSFDSIEMVDHVKSLGVIIQQKLNFELHMSSLLKLCSQRMYLLRLLRSQSLSANHLHTVFHAIVVSRILYALPAWGVFLNAGQSGRIDAILKRAYKCGFSKNRRPQK